MSEPREASALDELLTVLDCKMGLRNIERASIITPDDLAAARSELTALRSALAHAYSAGQLAMRERCAKVCDEHAIECDSLAVGISDRELKQRWIARKYQSECNAHELRALSPEEHERT